MADTAARSGRWLRWGLVASLALNLLFAGFVAGALLRGGPPEARPPLGLVSYARSLPEPHRRALMHAVQRSEPAWIAEREALSAAVEDLRAALVVEPFEPERVRAALSRQRAAQAALADRGLALMAERIEQMTPEERAAFAAGLERRGSPPRRLRR